MSENQVDTHVSRMKRDVYIALGSNLGDRWQYLRDAVDGLPDVVACSSVYETEPIGGPDNQGAYLNMVVKLNTELEAGELLRHAYKLERNAQRVRIEKDGPRTLDVDILVIKGEEHDTETLTVPHPRMWERNFVLTPLREIAPELVPEGSEARAVGEVWVAGSL